MKRHLKTRRTVRTIEALETRHCFAGYTLVDLGGLPGLSYIQSQPQAVNDSGDVAGLSYTAGTNGAVRHAVVWHRDAAGKYQTIDLGLLDGWSYASDINNRGEVVGVAGAANVGSYSFLVRPEDTNGDGQPDRWFRDNDGDGRNDLAVNLNSLPGGAGLPASATAINDNGQIAVGFEVVQIDAAGNLHTSGDLGTTVRDINNDGKAVGGDSLWQLDAAGNLVAGPTPLGTASGYSIPVNAESINRRGDMVAGKATNSQGYERAVTWKNGTMSDLGTLGGKQSGAYAANDLGEVVGLSSRKTGIGHPFRWQNGVMTDLNTYLPRKSNWELSTALDVNNTGWIVGEGKFMTSGSTSESRGFVLVPNAVALTAVAVPQYVTEQSLTAAQAQPLVSQALLRWQAAGADTSALGNVQIQVANLGGMTLGLASGNTIWLDANAAGWGWFIDRTPGSDSEFFTPGNQGEQDRIDLLTVVMHELGHLLGHEHDAQGVMADTLAAGVRRTGVEHDAVAQVDQIFRNTGNRHDFTWLGGWLNDQFDSARGRAKRRA